MVELRDRTDSVLGDSSNWAIWSIYCLVKIIIKYITDLLNQSPEKLCVCMSSLINIHFKIFILLGFAKPPIMIYQKINFRGWISIKGLQNVIKYNIRSTFKRLFNFIQLFFTYVNDVQILNASEVYQNIILGRFYFFIHTWNTKVVIPLKKH